MERKQLIILFLFSVTLFNCKTSMVDDQKVKEVELKMIPVFQKRELFEFQNGGSFNIDGSLSDEELIKAKKLDKSEKGINYFILNHSFHIKGDFLIAQAGTELGLYDNGKLESFYLDESSIVLQAKIKVKVGSKVKYYRNGVLAEFILASDYYSDGLTLLSEKPVGYYDNKRPWYFYAKDDFRLGRYVVKGGERIELHDNGMTKKIWSKEIVKIANYTISSGEIEFYKDGYFRKFYQEIDLKNKQGKIIVPARTQLIFGDNREISKLILNKNLELNKELVALKDTSLYIYQNKGIGYIVLAENTVANGFPAKALCPLYFYVNEQLARITVSEKFPVTPVVFAKADSEVFLHRDGFPQKVVLGEAYRDDSTGYRAPAGSEIAFYPSKKIQFITYTEDLPLKGQGILIENNTRLYKSENGELIRYVIKDDWQDPKTGFVLSGNSEVIKYDDSRYAKIVLAHDFIYQNGMKIKAFEPVYFHENGKPLRITLAEDWHYPDTMLTIKKGTSVHFSEEGKVISIGDENEMRKKSESIDSLYKDIRWQWEGFQELYEFEEPVS